MPLWDKERVGVGTCAKQIEYAVLDATQAERAGGMGLVCRLKPLGVYRPLSLTCRSLKSRVCAASLARCMAHKLTGDGSGRGTGFPARRRPITGRGAPERDEH
jgi:hypothetical protein